jgi:iron complex outermembrane receptor protein
MKFATSLRGQRLHVSAAAIALSTVVFAASASAQDAASDVVAPPATASATAPKEDNTIVVTGTLFRRANTETPSPVTVLTPDYLAKAGISNVSDAIRSISADGAGSIGTGFQSGFSAGGSAVSLRGLGVSSTLVLIDGLRSANFPINDDGHNAYVDLNSIPFSLVDKIEVLKDGASATYGADAIGGVVNIKLKKHFVGLEGKAEGGLASRGDAAHQRISLTAGYGDYENQGFNIYVNGEYQHDGRVSNASRGFPYNTQDLLSIGGIDKNTADSSMTTASPTAYVTRVAQTDLNNPLSGGTALLNPANASQYTALGLGNCTSGTFTASNGTGCKYDLVNQYRQIQPLQERYSANGRISFRVSDAIEGYVTGSYSHSYVSIWGTPQVIRNTQPFGGAPSLASSNPGIVLPVYICASGVNCATAANRTLNPNNPYAAAYANNPSQGAARIYYMFGDIPSGSDRSNDVYRATAGLHGRIADAWDWRVDGVYAYDKLKLVQHGLINIAALTQAINTGSYNFVNPSLNSNAVRQALAPDKTTPSHSETYSLDASVTRKLFTLPGGDLQLAVGGQIRHEMLENNNQNVALDTYNLTTASAFGSHTVSAAFFELDAPVFKQLELNASGRFDHYSEGFSHFSPKFGFKFTPTKAVALRGTYSQGFRAPTFAESGPRSQYAGFVSTTPPCAYILAHGGTSTANGCSANGNAYNTTYSLGRGVVGNPNLQPETSRSFTFGTIVQPVRWLSLTVDYYNVKKSNLIVTGPDIGKAVSAYFASSNLDAAKAAVAAVGPGYSVNTVDAVDPLYPNLLPRPLIINVPYVNANYMVTSGIDLSATANLRLTDKIRWTSRIEGTYLLTSNLHTAGGIQAYAGTFGPYDLSSGNGSPRLRGNWQNTLEFGEAFSLSLTTSYVGRIKEVATDQGSLSTDCSQNLYGTGNAFCFVSPFIDNDLTASFKFGNGGVFSLMVKNVLDAKAPIAPAAYASAPNFLTSWHYAGLIGREYRASVSFKM